MKTARIPAIAKEFPIGKIVCIGRNYVDHIKELGNETPAAPVIFMKPATSVIGNGDEIVIPPYSSNCHHEAELALLIGTGGKNIPDDQALSHLAGYGVAIDLTLRDVQDDLKKKGLPWEIAKGFDTACPLSDFVAAGTISDPQQLQIRLTVNDTLRQDGSTALMIHTVTQIVSHISTIFTLEPGDIILTGTPAGVGPLVSGDRVRAEISGVGSLTVTVT
ncbi:MAG TPA: fumarylacetoacetate hydrolase family protein [Geomobilimonas sp.]|nr:fumarylacetoacetate hydrolase family protein [Geomobilimonas sp.]